MLRNFRTPVLAAGFMLCSAGAMASSGTIELAENGSFETGDFSGWTQFDNGGTQMITSDNPSDGNFAAFLSSDGMAINSLIKNDNIGVGQVQAGDEVTISFDMRGTTEAGGVVFAEFFSELEGGGTSSAEILGGGPLFGSADWVTYSFTAIAGPDVSGGITFQIGAVCGAVPGCVSEIFVDNLSVTIAAPIPVPAAVWLFGSALGLLGLRRRNA